MKPYSLYITYRSPYARKVRVLLLEKQIPFDEMIVDLQNKAADFTALSAASTVPKLICPDGLILDDSTLILKYLEEVHPQPAFLPMDCRARYEVWNREELADRLCELNIALFFERQKTDPRREIFEKAERFTQVLLAEVEKSLVNSLYLVGDYSIADIALASVMDWMRFRLQTNWSQVAGLQTQAWLQRILERPSFVATPPFGLSVSSL